jgi:hypothetical protein
MAPGQAQSESARTTQPAQSVIAAGKLKSSRTVWPSPEATTCEPADSPHSAACPVATEPGATQFPTADASTSSQVQAKACPVAIEPGAMLPTPGRARPHPLDASTSPAMAARPHRSLDASTSPAMAARPHRSLDASTSFQVQAKACPVATEPGAMLLPTWTARPHPLDASTPSALAARPHLTSGLRSCL